MNEWTLRRGYEGIRIQDRHAYDAISPRADEFVETHVRDYATVCATRDDVRGSSAIAFPRNQETLQLRVEISLKMISVSFAIPAAPLWEFGESGSPKIIAE